MGGCTDHEQVPTPATLQISMQARMHPRMHSRTFVLLPLVEIAPTAVHPVLQQSVTELLVHDVEENGPAEERCQLLMRNSLEADDTMLGPGMEEA